MYEAMRASSGPNPTSGITESGQALARVKGVKLLRVEGDRAVLAVGSGKYKFRTPANF